MHFCVTIIVCMIIGYAFGCISPAYIIGRLNNIDIREHGSGNAGTTNTMRVLGRQAGIMVYLGDCIKCVLAIIVAMWIFKGADENVTLVKLVAGFGAVLGHNYPCWLHFKGGKGIAVTSAVILAVCLPDNWICPVVALLVFMLIVKVTRYVSLGSLMVVVIFFAYVTITFNGEENYIAMCLFSLLFALSAFYSHRANIVRLLNGTENKIGEKKADTQEDMSYGNDMYSTQNNDVNYNNTNYNDEYSNAYDNNMYGYSENYGNDYDSNYDNHYNNNYYNDPYVEQNYDMTNDYSGEQDFSQEYDNIYNNNDFESQTYNNEGYEEDTYSNGYTKESIQEPEEDEFAQVEKIKVDDDGVEVICNENKDVEIIKEEAEIIDVEADEIIEIKE